MKYPRSIVPQAAILTLAVLASGCRNLCEEYQRTYGWDSQRLVSLEDVRASLARDFSGDGLTFSVATGGISESGAAGIAWDSLDESDLDDLKHFAAVYEGAWRKYSARWIEGSGTRSITLVRNFHVRDEARRAYPDAPSGTLYYDVSHLSGCGTEEEEVIHHEFYHMVEAAHFGTAYYQDPTWNALNQPGFGGYGDGGETAYHQLFFTNSEHPSEGFVDTYATYGLEEDKAETYAWLMTPDFSGKLEDWATSDPVLARKAAYLRQFMRRNW